MAGRPAWPGRAGGGAACEAWWAAPDNRECSLFFGLRLSEECDSDVLRCRFSVSYLPTTPSSLEAEENDVTAIRRRLRKEAKSFSLTREFQDFKVLYRGDRL